jgi:hypothetical protein
MEDLIYNKWMTRTSTVTDGNGEAEFNGFYGSYKISATVGNTQMTVLVDCHKGDENTIYINMP